MLLVVFTGVDPREQYVFDCVYRSGSKRTMLLIVFTGVDPREYYVVDCVYRSGSKRTICC